MKIRMCLAGGVGDIEEGGIARMALCQEIQEAVGDQYDVYPITSSRAVEHFTLDSGRMGIAIHKTMVFGMPGNIDDVNVLGALKSQMINSVLEEWPIGTKVVWRKHPEFAYRTTMDGQLIVELRMRIGAVYLKK